MTRRTNPIGEASRRARRLAVLDGRVVDDYDRPTTRGDCVGAGFNASRPCPWAACRHNLLIDVLANGSIVLIAGHADVERLTHSCALDVVDALGASTLEVVSEVFGLSRERVRQIESMAVQSMKSKIKKE